MSHVLLLGESGQARPSELTPQEAAAFESVLQGAEKASAVDPDGCHDALVELGYGFEPHTESYLRGLVNESIMVIRDADAQNTRIARLHRFPNATYMNELAPFFGLEPGINTFTLVNSPEGGEIPPLAYLKHIAAKEAPLAMYNPDYVKHDREIDDHIVGWWTLPAKFVDDLAAKARQRVEAFENDPSSGNRNNLGDLTGAIDVASSIHPPFSSSAITDVFKGDKDSFGSLLIAGPRSLPEHVASLADVVREVYFDGEYGPVVTGLVYLKAIQLHRQRFRKALEMAELAEQARPEIGRHPIAHMGRHAVYWAKRHMPL